MLNRLKTLPLTILLTILIWMYAEAQFTSTRDGIRLAVKINSPSPDFALRILDARGNPYAGTAAALASLTITLQGPKNQLDRIYQQSLTQGGGGAAGLPDDEDFTSLAFTPPLSQRDLQNTDIDTVAMLNSLPYFRNHSVIVTSALPAHLKFDVDSVQHLSKPVDFTPTIRLDRFTLNPDQVTVNIPSRILQQISPDKISVSAAIQGARDLALLPPDSDQTLPVRYRIDNPDLRDDRITLSPPQGSVTVHIPKRQGITEIIPDLPVWISGPPALLNRYDIDLQPRFIRVLVSGSPEAIKALRQRLAAATPPDPAASNIHAYLDITPDDRPSPNLAPHSLRYTLPEGLTLQEAPTDLQFRLRDHPAPATQPTQTIPLTR